MSLILSSAAADLSLLSSSTKIPLHLVINILLFVGIENITVLREYMLFSKKMQDYLLFNFGSWIQIYKDLVFNEKISSFDPLWRGFNLKIRDFKRLNQPIDDGLIERQVVTHLLTRLVTPLSDEQFDRLLMEFIFMVRSRSINDTVRRTVGKYLNINRSMNIQYLKIILLFKIWNNFYDTQLQKYIVVLCAPETEPLILDHYQFFSQIYPDLTHNIPTQNTTNSNRNQLLNRVYLFLDSVFHLSSRRTHLFNFTSCLRSIAIPDSSLASCIRSRVFMWHFLSVFLRLLTVISPLSFHFFVGISKSFIPKILVLISIFLIFSLDLPLIFFFDHIFRLYYNDSVWKSNFDFDS